MRMGCAPKGPGDPCIRGTEKKRTPVDAMLVYFLVRKGVPCPPEPAPSKLRNVLILLAKGCSRNLNDCHLWEVLIRLRHEHMGAV